MNKIHFILQNKELTNVETFNQVKEEINKKKKAFDIQAKSPSFFAFRSQNCKFINPKNSWIKKFSNFELFLKSPDSFGNDVLIYSLRKNDINLVSLILKEYKSQFSLLEIYDIVNRVNLFFDLDLKIHEKLLLKKEENNGNLILREIVNPNPLNPKNNRNILTRILESNNENLIKIYLKTILKVYNKESNKDLNTKEKFFTKELKKTLNYRNDKGTTVLGIFIENNYSKETIELLLSFNLVDINKKYSLFINKDYIEYNINVNEENEFIPTNINIENGIAKVKTNRFIRDEYPIHRLLDNKNYEILELLLSNPQLKSKVKDNNGKTLYQKSNFLSNHLKDLIIIANGQNPFQIN